MLDWVRLKYSMYVCLSVYIHIYVVQNENVNRHSTNECQVRDLRRIYRLVSKKRGLFVDATGWLAISHDNENISY